MKIFMEGLPDNFPETIVTKAGEKYKKLAGKAIERRTYMRWEDPIFGVNDESRVTPVNQGCQQITTVIGPDGNIAIAVMAKAEFLSRMTPHSDEELSKLLNNDIAILSVVYISAPAILIIILFVFFKYSRR